MPFNTAPDASEPSEASRWTPWRWPRVIRRLCHRAFGTRSAKTQLICMARPRRLRRPSQHTPASEIAPQPPGSLLAGIL